jgi:hypothetical protein
LAAADLIEKGATLRVALISMYDQGTHGHRSISAYLKASGIEVHNIFFGDKILDEVRLV